MLDISDVMGDLTEGDGRDQSRGHPADRGRGGKHYAVPMGLSPIVFYARMDLLEKAGYGTFPETWDKFVEAG